MMMTNLDFIDLPSISLPISVKAAGPAPRCISR